MFPNPIEKGGTRVYDSRNKKYFYLTSWDVIIRSYWYDTQGRTNYLTNDNDRSFCKNYSENDDKSDLGLWRAPNQREMMLMYIQNKNCVDGTLARTYWHMKEENDSSVLIEICTCLIRQTRQQHSNCVVYAM